jgi:phage terminase small subunit
MAKIRPILLKSVQEELTHRQKAFIHIYLEAKTVEDACRSSKVAKGTVYNWMKDPLFQKELEHQREEILRRAFHRLNAYLDRAIITYVNLLASESEGVRMRTAEGIIDRILKFREQEGIIERIETIEKILSERRHD